MNLFQAALVAAFLLLPATAIAESPPHVYVLSSGLVEEIFQQLAKEPYANVAGLITKLQSEVLPQNQPKPTAEEKK